MSPRVWRHRITDIIDAIKKIQQYVEGMDFDAFQKDSRTIDAVVRNFIVIGEAARNVPEEISTGHPSIPWRIMADMRNFAVHEYWGMEFSTLWETIAHDLPPLLPLLEELLQEKGPS